MGDRRGIDRSGAAGFPIALALGIVDGWILWIPAEDGAACLGLSYLSREIWTQFF